MKISLKNRPASSDSAAVIPATNSGVSSPNIFFVAYRSKNSTSTRRYSSKCSGLLCRKPSAACELHTICSTFSMLAPLSMSSRSDSRIAATSSASVLDWRIMLNLTYTKLENLASRTLRKSFSASFSRKDQRLLSASCFWVDFS